MFLRTIALTKKIAVLCGTFAVFGLTTNAVQAQEFPAPQKAIKTTERVYNSSVPLSKEMKQQMQPGIRYTVGSVKTKGWHKGLVKGNRNLGHYYWAPMNHMVQATSSNKTKVQYRKAQPKQRSFHYIKPIHAANPLNPHPFPKRAVAKKAKYIHRSNPHNKQVAASVRFLKNRHKSGVSGKLISTTTGAKLYSSDYNTSSSKATRGYLSSKDAYGKILND